MEDLPIIDKRRRSRGFAPLPWRPGCDSVVVVIPGTMEEQRIPVNLLFCRA